MISYYDALNSAFDLFEQERTTSSAQLVYLHLLQLNNSSGRSGSVQVSDRELERLTSLNKNTITKAKQVLKNLNLVDFKTEHGKHTTYTLKVFQPKQLGHMVGQLVGQSIGQSLSSTSISSNTRERIEIRDNGACAKNENIEEIGLLMDYWEQAGGSKPNQLLISKLAALLKKHGLATLKAAIDKANEGTNSKYGFSLDYVKTKLPKGAVANETSYAKPKQAKRLDWLD